ncbi:hypothetical protein AMTRI_Chr01g129270 [Amborella trichopoda]
MELISMTTTSPLVVTGDFNATLFSHEKRGSGPFNMGSANDFLAMIDSCSLIGLHSIGSKFTWCNNRRHGNVMAVLDRGLCNDAWFNFFHDCTEKVLPRPNNIPFRMQRFWTNHKDFSEVVSQTWSTPVNGTPIFIVAKKLKRLKADLKIWAKSTFPQRNKLVKSITVELRDIQETIENVGSNDFLLDQELEAKAKLHNALGIQEKLWAKKSRIKWLKCGDRNTKFFHLTTKIRQAKNFMRD